MSSSVENQTMKTENHPKHYHAFTKCINL